MQRDSNIPDNNSIPEGYCQCGCGGKTTIAPQTHSSLGYKKGQPRRYIIGHNARLPKLVPAPGDMKKCPGCMKYLEVSNFGKRRRSRDGLYEHCRACQAASYLKNKEKYSYQRASYRKRNKHLLSVRNREWVIKNREALKEKKRAHWLANKERISAQRAVRRKDPAVRERLANQDRAWRRNNPHAVRQHRRNRRARLTAGGGHISVSQWESLLVRFGGKCAKCGSGDDIQMDHVVPLAKGGRHSIDNVQPLCQPCNSRKYTSVEDYRGTMYKGLKLFDD